LKEERRGINDRKVPDQRPADGRGLSAGSSNLIRIGAGFLFLVTALALLAGVPAWAGPAGGPQVVVPEDTPCAECGMICRVDSPFTSRMDKADGGRLFFCDTGDLLTFLKARGGKGAENAWVRDYGSGVWIPAWKAYYVQDPKAFRTPMRWGIAAFGSHEAAARHGRPLAFGEILEATP